MQKYSKEVKYFRLDQKLTKKIISYVNAAFAFFYDTSGSSDSRITRSTRNTRANRKVISPAS